MYARTSEKTTAMVEEAGWRLKEVRRRITGVAQHFSVAQACTCKPNTLMALYTRGVRQGGRTPRANSAIIRRFKGSHKSHLRPLLSLVYIKEGYRPGETKFSLFLVCGPQYTRANRPTESSPITIHPLTRFSGKHQSR